MGCTILLYKPFRSMLTYLKKDFCNHKIDKIHPESNRSEVVAPSNSRKQKSVKKYNKI